MNGKQHRSELPNGTKIEMGSKALTFNEVLNRGGFGIIYKGAYKKQNHEEKIVAIKEYLPEGLATRGEGEQYIQVVTQEKENFQNGLKDFLGEAKILKECQHHNIVRFYDETQMHNTAYIVMELVYGEDLSAYLKHEGRLREDELKDILYPLLDALEKVHQKEFLHRDIKPANIVLRNNDRSPVLLDFGSAQSVGPNQKVVVTDPYSPPEQYVLGIEQGPWTDIYALGAVCYQALTGQLPQSGDQRNPDNDLGIFTFNKEGESTKFCEAIDPALNINSQDRPQTVKGWKKMMEPPSPAPDPTVVADRVPPTKLKKPPKPLPSDRKIAAGLIGLVFSSIALGVLLYRLWDVDWGVWFGGEGPDQTELEERRQEQTELDGEKETFFRETGQEPSPRGISKTKESHLRVAVRLNLGLLIRDLIDKGVNVNDSLLLHTAAQNDAVKAVVALIDKGANFHAQDYFGQTPLHYAAQNDAVEAARALIRKGAFVNAQDKMGRTPLHFAAQNDAVEAARALIRKGALVNAQDKMGRTPLHMAAWYGYPNIAEVLLNEGSNVDTRDKDGRTPLHYAALTMPPIKRPDNYPAVAEVLLNEGSNVDARDKDGWTPLHHAVSRPGSSHKVMEVLLEWGADMDAETNDGKMPKDMEYYDNVEYLFFHFRTLSDLKESLK